VYRFIAGSFRRQVALVAVEHVLIVLAVVAAAVLRLGFPEDPAQRYLDWVLRAMVVAGVLQVCLHYGDLYDMRKTADRRELLVGSLRSLGAASAILAIAYYWIPSLVLGRGVVALATMLMMVLLIGWRIAFEWLSLRGQPAERLLIVGHSGAAISLARELFERRSELGVELVGFIDPDATKIAVGDFTPRAIGAVSDIPAIVRERRVDRVVVSLANARGTLNMDELLAMKLNQGVRFDHLASVYEQYTGKIAVENLRPSWMIFGDGFRKSPTVAALKRQSDIVLALLGLVLASPAMFVVWLALRFGSNGPVLYSQTRVGKDGVNFTIYKFRSMRVDAEAVSGAVWSMQNDPRVTPFRRFLRRTRLDELPQLWNVLRGDMSIVGPRPERPEFIAELTRKIPFYGQRHVVRPGLTGWAQVRHRYGSTIDDAQEKLQYDIFYIKHLSLAFDVYIVLETIKTVLVRRGS
jgi:sugar transferase (PEP-CTERM system associated)